MRKRFILYSIIPLSAVAFLSILTLSCTTQNPVALPSLLRLQTVATGLNFPLYLTAPPGDNDRLFVVEKGGTIRIIKNGSLLGTPFLDISGLVSTGDEQGLLGLAFDPAYGINGRFYVSYTDVAGYSKIVRYLVSGNPDIAQPGPDRTLLI